MTHHVDLDTIALKHGGHEDRDNGVCLLEAVAWWAHEPHSDHPQCVSPVLAAFGRSWNDALPDDATRDRLLKPFVTKLPGTNTGTEDDERRAWMATDWLVRVHTPAWLRLAGLTEQAERLESLPELNPETCPPILPTLEAVRADASAAWSAARSAAWSAAWSAARSAARSAAWSAARSAARSAAWSAARSAAESAAESAAWSAAESAARSAARSAAESAARSAAWSALLPTVEALQASAVVLFDRMIQVGPTVPA